MGILLVIVLAFALIWIFLIRPQRRRQMEQLDLQDSIDVGTEVVTAGGLYGTVRGVAEERLSVEIAPGTTVQVARRAIAGVVSDEQEEPRAELPDRAAS